MKLIISLIILILDNYRAKIRLLAGLTKVSGSPKANLKLFEKKLILLGNGKSLNQIEKLPITKDSNSVSIGLSLSTLHEFDADYYYWESPSVERFHNNENYFKQYFEVRRKGINFKAKKSSTIFMFDESCISEVHDTYSGIDFDSLSHLFLGHINMRLTGSNKNFTKLIDLYITLQQIGICSRSITLGNFSLFRLLQFCVMHKVEEIHLIGFNLSGEPFYKWNKSVADKLNVTLQFILDYELKEHPNGHVTNDPSLNNITAEHVLNAFQKICHRRGIKFYMHEGDSI